MSDQRPKVVSMTGNPIRSPGEPNPDIISAAKDLLERAENGNIKGIAIVMMHHDDACSYQAIGTKGYSMVGAIEHLKRDFM